MMLEEVMLDEDEMGHFPLANAHSITVVISVATNGKQNCWRRRIIHFGVVRFVAITCSTPYGHK